MHVAVDAGAMQAGDGIARYVEQTIAAIDRLASGAVTWSLYGRGPVHDYGARLHAARSRSDRLPLQAGRTLGMFLSLPLWTARDRPDLFWGPAHRLPWHVPAGTAQVVSIHDLCWKRHPDTMRPMTRWLDRCLMPRALQRADRILAASNATLADLVSAFPQHAERASVGYPVPPRLPDVADAPLPAAWRLDAPYALFVGTPEPRKNLDRLLAAFATLAHGPERRLLAIVGSGGWGGQSPQALVERHRLHDRVRVLGRVDDAALALLYRHARLLAMPSRYEGFGLPLVEAMAQGTPVLTSDRSAMPEVVGDAALLVDPDRTESIAAGLQRLFEDDALHAQLAARARQEAARFTDAASARAMLYAFERALARRRAAAPAAAGR